MQITPLYTPKIWKLGFWQKLAWELGFGPNLGWELGFGTPLHDPHKHPYLILQATKRMPVAQVQ